MVLFSITLKSLKIITSLFIILTRKGATSTVIKQSHFVFHRRNSVIWVWTNMRMSK